MEIADLELLITAQVFALTLMLGYLFVRVMLAILGDGLEPLMDPVTRFGSWVKSLDQKGGGS